MHIPAALIFALCFALSACTETSPSNASATTANAATGTESAAGLRDLKEVIARFSKSYDTCPGFKTEIESAILACIDAEYALQDKQLNQTYLKALAGLDAEQKARLRVAQRVVAPKRPDTVTGLIWLR